MDSLQWAQTTIWVTLYGLWVLWGHDVIQDSCHLEFFKNLELLQKAWPNATKFDTVAFWSIFQAGNQQCKPNKHKVTLGTPRILVKQLTSMNLTLTLLKPFITKVLLWHSLIQALSWWGCMASKKKMRGSGKRGCTLPDPLSSALSPTRLLFCSLLFLFATTN